RKTPLFDLEEDGRTPRHVRADHRYHGLPRPDRERGRLLQGARHPAPDLADDTGPLQGLSVDSQVERLSFAAYGADLRELDAGRGADPHTRNAPDQRIRAGGALGLQAGRSA